jgi:hypothetical protein
MAVYTFFETVLLSAYTVPHSFITLMLQQVHVVATHKIRVFNTTVTLAHWDNGHWHTTGVRHTLFIRCSSHNRKAGYINQHYRDHDKGTAAYGHGLLSHAHFDIA